MSDTYKQVLAIVARVLQCRDLDPRLDLVDLGANSLKILQIVELVGEASGVAVSLTDVLDAPDVDSFAQLVADRGKITSHGAGR